MYRSAFNRCISLINRSWHEHLKEKDLVTCVLQCKAVIDLSVNVSIHVAFSSACNGASFWYYRLSWIPMLGLSKLWIPCPYITSNTDSFTKTFQFGKKTLVLLVHWGKKCVVIPVLCAIHHTHYKHCQSINTSIFRSLLSEFLTSFCNEWMERYRSGSKSQSCRVLTQCHVWIWPSSWIKLPYFVFFQFRSDIGR